jgi:siroheme synthase
MSIVILMGLGERSRIASRLRRQGWPDVTPVAVILGASGDEAATWRGTLAGGIGQDWRSARAHLPGTIVVGPTAALSLLPLAASDLASRPLPTAAHTA